MTMKLVILDRDGTINYSGDDGYVVSADAWTPLPGALQAIARLNHAGYQVVVVSNQPGLGGGLIDVATLNAIHTTMHRQLAEVGARVEAIFLCPHAPDQDCDCRMPRAGLFHKISERFGIDLHGVAMVGDRVCDLKAGAAVGCSLHGVRTGSGEFSPSNTPGNLPEGVHLHDDLAAFVTHWLGK